MLGLRWARRSLPLGPFQAFLECPERVLLLLLSKPNCADLSFVSIYQKPRLELKLKVKLAQAQRLYEIRRREAVEDAHNK